MKPLFLFASLASALALAGCGGDNTLQGATGYIYAQGAPTDRAPAPPPPEGVYPDCKYGVVPPDDGTGPACLKPTNRD